MKEDNTVASVLGNWGIEWVSGEGNPKSLKRKGAEDAEQLYPHVLTHFIILKTAPPNSNP